MQIHLKQNEIESALRDYVAKLGINLRGREVAITFTSGRQGRGMTADLDIPDIDDLPDFPEDEAIPAGPINRATHLKVVDTASEQDAEVVVQAEEIPVEAEDAPPFEPSKPATASLFG